MVSLDLPHHLRSTPTTPPLSQTITIDIKGMKCAGCVAAVERQLRQQQGVISAQVNLITSVALVEYETKTIEPEILAHKLTAVGFPSAIRVADTQFNANWQTSQQQQRLEERREQNYYLITSAVLLFFSTIGHLHHWGLPHLPIVSNILFHWLLATFALLIPGREILLNGWRGLWYRQANMNSLVALGTVVAYITSCLALVFPEWGWECFFDEPVMLLGFIFLGRVLEARARNRASDSLSALLKIRPQFARLIAKTSPNEDAGVKIPANQIKPQEWVRVLIGEQFPVDGQIIAGETTVDESILTGEYLPVVKTLGAEVSAGTINLSGVVIVETVNSGEKTKLNQIIAMVESAQTRKAPVQKLADTISGYFAYGIMAIALATFLFWYGWGTKIWLDLLINLDTSPLILSVKLAIDVLVIACPCALGLATPTAILVGTGIGAENGLLIRGGDVLEQVKDVDTIVFDKTGTLTHGQPQVTDVIPLRVNQVKLLQVAASLEKNANHPLAMGIIAEAQKQEISLLSTESIVNVAGKGVKGKLKDQETNLLINCYLGNRLWLRENKVEIESEIDNQVLELENQGKTVVYLAQSSKVIGLIALADSLRDDAIATISQLQQTGFQTVIMSGDRPQVVKNIADKLQITTYYGGIQPQQKAKLIEDLQKQQTVAMVGDGINDAPGMVAAQLAIAMPQGAEVAVHTANIVLTRGKLMDIVKAIKLSKLTLNKIKQNLFWALGYNVIAIPVAAGCFLPEYHVWLNPATAGALMAFSSVLVVTNSLLLKTQYSSDSSINTDKDLFFSFTRT